MGMIIAGPLVETYWVNKDILVIWSELLTGKLFTHYGVCYQIHLDQGSEFNSYLLKEVCHLWGRSIRPEPLLLPHGLMERWSRVTCWFPQMLWHMCCNDLKA